MNIGFHETDFVRNTSYTSHIFSSSIRSKADYEELKTIIQINFNNYEISRDINKYNNFKIVLMLVK